MGEEKKISVMASRMNKITLDLGCGVVAGFAAAVLSQVRHLFLTTGKHKFIAVLSLRP
jgi:hypothetical protein